MHGTLVKVTLTAMFLLCGITVLLEAKGDSKKALKRMRHQMVAFLATLQAHKLTSSSIASFIDWYLFNYNRNSAVDSGDLNVVFLEGKFTKNHAHLWIPFLQWLEVFPKGETPNPKAESIIPLTVQLQETIEATLYSRGSSPEKDVYLLLDSFNSEYREKVALPGKVPKLNVKFKIERMAEYVLIGKWLLEEWEKQNGMRTESEKFDKEIAILQDKIERLHEERKRLNIDASSFVAFLTDYVESRTAKEPSMYCAKSKRQMKVQEIHTCYWATFLDEIGALPPGGLIDCPEKQSLNQVSLGKLKERVPSAVLAKIRGQKKGTSFQVKQLLESFYRGYHQLLVLTCWDEDGKYPENNDKSFWLERMAEFCALSEWRLQRWKQEKQEKQEKTSKKTEMCLQKCTFKGAAAIVGAAIAARYGLPPLWAALFGKANETGETTPGQEEEEVFQEIEEPNVEKEPKKPQITGKDKETITKAGSKTWIYILIVTLILLTFIIGVAVTGWWLSGFIQVRDPRDIAGLSQTLEHSNDFGGSLSATTIGERSFAQVNPPDDPGSGKYYPWDPTGPSDGRIHSQPNLLTGFGIDGLEPSASVSQHARRHTF